MLLTADWHLTDKPQDEYRWAVFGAVRAALTKEPQRVAILGDLGDRKDRHSSALVNRLFRELRGLLDAGATDIQIIKGNHDAAVRGEPYWNTLNSIDRRIVFHSDPSKSIGDKLLFLPWEEDPATAWADVPFKGVRAVFVHQTVTGAVVEGRSLDNPKMPVLPRGLKIYSGDIHTPQKVGGVVYVGAPHHVKFGDTYPCRMLIVDDETFAIREELILSPAAKALLEVASLPELIERAAGMGEGDQIKVRFAMAPEGLAGWPALQKGMHDWARTRGIRIDSTEVLIRDEGKASVAGAAPRLDMDPATILAAFCRAHNVDTPKVHVGLSLLERALHG